MLDQTPREGAHTLEPLLAHVSRLARLLVQEGHPGRGRDLTGSLKNTVLNMWAPVFESRPTRFIVLARYRSGSTLLSDALNSHAGVLCLDELYNISALAGDLAKLEDPIAIARTAFEPPREADPPPGTHIDGWRAWRRRISDLLAPDGTFIHPRAAERTKFCSAHNRPAPEAVTSARDGERV